MLCPHPEHRVFTGSTGAPARFLSTFPFGVDVDGDGTIGEQGVWTIGLGGNYLQSGGSPPTPSVIYEYHADADGDGINEAVWLDFDFPPQEDPSLPAGTKFIPMFGVTIYDLDGLLNLNIHGNLHAGTDGALNPRVSLAADPLLVRVGPDNQPGVAGIDDDGDGTVDNAIELGWPGSDDYLSRSNLGITPQK